MTQFYLHVGLPKTGTTSLQVQIFQEHPEIEYIGKYIKWPQRELRINELVTKICTSEVSPNDLTWWEDFYNSIFKSAQADNKIILFSEELLYGLTSENHSFIAPRLVDVLKPDKVLITLRSQPEMIKSIYRHRVSRGREVVSIDQYLENTWESVYSLTLDYEKNISQYEQLVGANNLGIFLYENFRNDAKKYIFEICHFLNISSLDVIDIKEDNAALSNRDLKARALMDIYRSIRGDFLPNVHLGKMIPGFAKNYAANIIRQGRRPEIEMSEEWADRINNHFAPTNRNLAQTHFLPLQENGYPF